jgi:hypothetical protein
VLRGFILALGLKRQFPEMLHHGIGIDFADWAQLVFALEGAFVFEFFLAFAEEVADNVTDSAEPTLAFQAGLILVLGFQFFFTFSRVLIFEFVHQFTLGLISHDTSSCKGG